MHRLSPLAALGVAAVVGAAVAAIVAVGVVAARDPDSTRTPHPYVAVARNTSVFSSPIDVRAVLAKVQGSVVAITRRGDTTGMLGSGSVAGTGFAVSADGAIVTNDHVVSALSGPIDVTLVNGTHRPATVTGEDPAADLAVLTVDATGLTPATLGDSNRAQVGDAVIAIGNALALAGQPSVTHGIVSALNRSVTTPTTTLEHMLQTDAAINPGNSGGPLVNAAGQVIGINTAIADPTQAHQIGFAIPISRAAPIIATLRRGTSVQPAFLGVTTETVTPAIATELNLKVATGAVVERVEPGSPAVAAGIQVADVILQIDDTPTPTSDDVTTTIIGHQPGDQISITVNRNGTNQVLRATLATRPPSLG